MNLSSAILGLLDWKPFSGYDLKRIISGSDLYYWSGNNNQIYKVLLELWRERLVTFEVRQHSQACPPRRSIPPTTRDAPHCVKACCKGRRFRIGPGAS